METIKLQAVSSYFKMIKPPTLKQYLQRRFVREVMSQVKGENGVSVDAGTGRKAPASAIKAKELMQGKKAEVLMTEHPEWVEEYKKGHGDVAGNKEA